MQDDFIHRFTAKAIATDAIRAAWLTGSLGRDAADRYADVDVALLLADKASFAAQAEAWLNSIAPLVLYRLMFNGSMINAMTDQALRVDIWLYDDREIVLQEGQALTLVDKDHALRWTDTPPESAQAAEAAKLEEQIQEFWRMIALLPTVLGRRETIVALQGLGFETGVVADLLIAHAGRRRDRGIKNLNEYLDDEARKTFEDALDFRLSVPQELARAHLRLAAIVQQIGPELAERRGFAYPQKLEQTVVAYVGRELARIGLDMD